MPSNLMGAGNRMPRHRSAAQVQADQDARRAEDERAGLIPPRRTAERDDADEM